MTGDICVRDARSSIEYQSRLDGDEKLLIYKIAQMLYTRGWPVGFGFIMDRGTSIILGLASCRGGKRSSIV